MVVLGKEVLKLALLTFPHAYTRLRSKMNLVWFGLVVWDLDSEIQ